VMRFGIVENIVAFCTINIIAIRDNQF